MNNKNISEITLHKQRKIVRPNGEDPDTTVYAYDGMYAVCEFGGHQDLKFNYIYANGLLLARYDESPADNHYYHHDGLGSIMSLTNENGAVEHSYFYEEFGISLGSWGTIDNHYLYTGQEYDGSISSLYNLRARYYKPDIGRFISEDPVGFNIELPQMLNLYLYVENNPINWRDITGLFTTCYPILSIPGFWYDVGEPVLLSTQWVLIVAMQEAGGVPSIGGSPGYTLTCAFREWLYYNQHQARTWHTLELCKTIEFCYYNIFFRTSESVEFRDVLRIKQGRMKWIQRDYATPVIPQLMCWELFREEKP